MVSVRRSKFNCWYSCLSCARGVQRELLWGTSCWHLGTWSERASISLVLKRVTLPSLNLRTSNCIIIIIYWNNNCLSVQNEAGSICIIKMYLKIERKALLSTSCISVSFNSWELLMGHLCTTNYLSIAAATCGLGWSGFVLFCFQSNLASAVSVAGQKIACWWWWPAWIVGDWFRYASMFSCLGLSPLPLRLYLKHTMQLCTRRCPLLTFPCCRWNVTLFAACKKLPMLLGGPKCFSESIAKLWMIMSGANDQVPQLGLTGNLL